MCLVPMEARKDTESPKAGFIDNFEKHLDAENWIHVLYKSSKCY